MINIVEIYVRRNKSADLAFRFGCPEGKEIDNSHPHTHTKGYPIEEITQINKAMQYLSSSDNEYPYR